MSTKITVTDKNNQIVDEYSYDGAKDGKEPPSHEVGAVKFSAHGLSCFSTGMNREDIAAVQYSTVHVQERTVDPVDQVDQVDPITPLDPLTPAAPEAPTSSLTTALVPPSTRRNVAQLGLCF